MKLTGGRQQRRRRGARASLLGNERAEQGQGKAPPGLFLGTSCHSCSSCSCLSRSSRWKEPLGCPLGPCSCCHLALAMQSTTKKCKEAALPEGLTVALSHCRGLQSCGAQRVNFDSDVEKPLVELATQLATASLLLKEHFSRRNEISCHTENDSDDGAHFEI